MAYREIDTTHRVLQFILGSLIGAGSGLWASSSFPDQPIWLLMLVGAGVLGTLAAIFGDKLWYGLKGNWPG